MDWGEVIVSLAGILIPILGIVGTFGVVVFVVWLRTRQRKAELEMRAQIYNRLLEKYGSAQELAEFLKTEEGRAFLRGLAMPPARRPATVLRWIRTGLILTFLGLACILLGWWPACEEPDLMVPGVILTALGIAFLLGAGVTHWLGRRLDESETESR
jgi:hypothetical protein